MSSGYYDGVLAELDMLARRGGGRLAYKHVEEYGDPEFGPYIDDAGLESRLVEALRRIGIERLYKFQYDALQAYRRGESFVVVSGTGTGKTEAFMIPILDSILKHGVGAPRPYAILVYPTKALARDQLYRIRVLAEGMLGLRVAVLDGDTPRDERTSIYASPPHILITNPDMMHVGLAFSDRIRRLIRESRVLVLDELHVYRGVFGSHVKWVVYRMLLEMSDDVVVIGSGATIGNPGDLGAKLFGRSVRVVEGPPRRKGTAIHVFIDSGSMSRWSLTAGIIAVLARRGIKTLAFTDSQQMAELVARIAKKSYGVRVGVHRAGIEASERRRVEEDFREGRLMAVVSTPTMELGVDLGDLDAVVMANLPRSYSSYVQRAGRAGRRDKPGLVVTVMGDDAIEAYFLRKPYEFFRQQPEPSYIEPGNREIAMVHLAALSLQRPGIRISQDER
ncbi:MAG: DEAD/DEAH box helicase [Desulfurococcales archaeon]|nr:DEAD/DEAH box helicase [Desulfurococcales archaeon]